jgi:hypothetical protein
MGSHNGRQYLSDGDKAITAKVKTPPTTTNLRLANTNYLVIGEHISSSGREVSASSCSEALGHSADEGAAQALAPQRLKSHCGPALELLLFQSILHSRDTALEEAAHLRVPGAEGFEDERGERHVARSSTA